MLPKFRPTAASFAVLASLIAALAAHCVMQRLSGDEIAGSPFNGHAHEALGPVASIALAFGIAVVALGAMRAWLRRRETDPLVAIARDLCAISERRAALYTIGGAVVVLWAMESYEQFRAFGRLVRVADAFGGNAICGSSILVLVAVLVAIGGLRFARALVASASKAARLLRAWIAISARTNRDVRVVRPRSFARAAAGVALDVFGMRAPPSGSALII